MKHILVTGGAGFAGSNLAVDLKLHNPTARVTAFDNLKRRGSELVLPRLREHGVEFFHGDVRIKEDLLAVGPVDLVVDCAAEPSVLAGRHGGPEYVVSTNLIGTVNCLEVCRTHGAAVVFLSTSRVYPIGPLNDIAYAETETRFELTSPQEMQGVSQEGVSERFPIEGVRSLYGATKLASELLLHEYRALYGIRGFVNRCGVLTGPWQMGKVDQGVVVLWAARHIFGGELAYLGYGGSGKQVRDILHIRDLSELLRLQIANLDTIDGETFNVGGGRQVSVSLRELTELCQRIAGTTIPVRGVPEGREGDVRIYLTDASRVRALLNWAPRYSVEDILQEIVEWIRGHHDQLEAVLR
jgi:CDP-paratose 2-epimerase